MDKAVQYPRLTISQNTSLPMPFVRVQCSSMDSADVVETDDLYFVTDALYDPTGQYKPDFPQWKVSSKTGNDSREAGEADGVVVTWIDAHEIKSTAGDTLDTSLALVVTLIETTTDYGDRAAYIAPCIIDARWIQSATAFKPKTTDQPQTYLTAMLRFPTWSDSAHRQWAGAMNNPIPDPDNPQPDSAMNNPIPDPANPQPDPYENNELYIEPEVGFLEDILQQGIIT
ncbi:hypothetical protein F4803DRAFT_555357 [Xylaria telfairii]|nr:hypothetical protein F4803DRAFT_555357 [Xylaria telfairii]